MLRNSGGIPRGDWLTTPDDFRRWALMPEQPVELVDHLVTRAIQLMRVFTEQVETMSRLKGKNSQQSVIVEHVTVAGGGQAIVGTVTPGGGGNP